VTTRFLQFATIFEIRLHGAAHQQFAHGPLLPGPAVGRAHASHGHCLFALAILMLHAA